MKVTFHHPPTGTVNPFLDFDPTNKAHYPPEAPGVYVYGIRCYIDGILKFIPVVVGETLKIGLRSRLFDNHYQKKFCNPLWNISGRTPSRKVGDPKELWNFSSLRQTKSDINALYSELKIYDKMPSASKKAIVPVAALGELIYFQNFQFYDYKLTGHFTGPPVNIKIDVAYDKILSLPINSTVKKNEINKIVRTLNNFKDHFYYIYAIIEDRSINLKNIEKATKEKLINDYQIYTTADDRKGTNDGIDIDFSQASMHFPNLMNNHL